MTSIKKRVSNIIMAILLLVGTVLYPIEAHAEGVETLPLGVYNITKNGSFSFQGNNLTPVKTVMGDSLRLVGVASWCAERDQGIQTTPIQLVIEIRDAGTGQRIGNAYTTIINPGQQHVAFGTPYWYLGRTGRQIQIFFESNSINGPMNGGYRALQIDYLASAVL